MKNFDMKTGKSTLRVLIFDFDETLYYSPNALDCYVRFIKTTILNLSNYTEEQTMEIMNKYGFTSRGENRVSFGKTCESFGIPKSAWEEYKLDHFYEIDYQNASIVNNDLLKELSKKYPLYIVSNEIYENVVYKASKLNIDLNNFTKIYAPRRNVDKSINKRDCYAEILSVNGIQPAEAIVIGDRYSVDIKPFEEIGGQGIQISNVKEIEDILLQLL